MKQTNYERFIFCPFLLLRLALLLRKLRSDFTKLLDE
jgi:hypothetical protein